MRLNLQLFAASKSTTFSESNISIENNTSSLTINIYFSANNSQTYFLNPTALNCTCNGVTQTQYVTHPLGGSVSTSFTFDNIAHNSDGTKSVSWNWNCNTGTSVLGNISDSGTRTLTTIPRATPAVAVSGNVEDTVTIALQPYVSTFKHSVRVVFGSISKYINASGNLQTTEVKTLSSPVSFTIPTEFYAQFTGQSATGTIYVTTYNNGTQIGSTTSATLTIYASQTRCQPSISGTVIDSNSATTTLTGNANKLIKGFSTAYLNLTISATSTSGDSNTTITSRNVNGTSFTGNTVSITKVTNNSFVVTVTNSRNISNTATLKKENLAASSA